MKTRNYVVVSVLLCTIAMCIIDGIIKPPYLYKSLLKIICFLIIPFVKYKSMNISKLFVMKKENIKYSIVLGISVFSVIMVAYFICKSFIDLSAIENMLNMSEINKDNFIYVALYISFINSLLEEFFFRGYAFLVLKDVSSRKFAYVFSSFMFAIYHAGMTSGWFNIIIYFLALFGLFIGGCIFNYLNERYENIYPSWIVHMCANFAINTIGLMMFGIL